MWESNTTEATTCQPEPEPISAQEIPMLTITFPTSELEIPTLSITFASDSPVQTVIFL
jgi:hypothetical protein